MRRKTRTVLRLRKLRRDREMTQAELARRVSLSTVAICEIEKGKYQPSLKKAIEIAEVFGVRVEDLLQPVEVPA
jgi:putative transcriptional regulator